MMMLLVVFLKRMNLYTTLMMKDYMYLKKNRHSSLNGYYIRVFKKSVT